MRKSTPCSLRRDGIGVGLGNALDDLDIFDIELVAAGGALVGADLAGDDDARTPA
jgi:hypothetical protein